MDFKKLAEMAKIQNALEEDAEPSGSPVNSRDNVEAEDDMGIYIPIDDDAPTEPERIPEDGFSSNDKNDNSTEPPAESLDSLLSKCFIDEKAYNIEIERLLPYHSPIFRGDGDISELKSSIARIGITEALLIKSVGNGEYEILSGNRRKRAAEELLWTKVPCKIADNEELNEDTEKKIIIESNLNRLSNLELMSERIRVCAALGEKRSSELGISSKDAERYIRLSTLDEAFLNMIDNDTLSIEAAELLSGLNDKAQKQTLAVLEQHPEYKITVANASELAESKRFTADCIGKILKPKPPVNVAVPAEIITEYMNGKTSEELTEIVTAAIKFYFLQ